jgi:hypothetical protein
VPSFRSCSSLILSLTFAASLAALSSILVGCASVSQAPTASPQAALSLSSSSYDFKTVVVGQTASQTLHITNSGNASLQITALSISNKLFTLSGPSVPRAVLPTMSLDYTLTFTPTAAGNASATLNIGSNASNATTPVALAGVGEKAVAALQISPNPLNFGNLTLQTTSTQNVTLQNTGDINLTVSGVTLAGAGFGYSSISPGFSLSPNQKLTFQVWFKPQTTGPYSGTVSFLSTNLSTPATMTLSGDGVTTAPPPTPPPTTQHTVHLTWGPSSSHVAGYRVYRSLVSGNSYNPLNGSVIDALTYDDSTVASGTTYYYVVTALDAEGVESLDSNQAAAAVPSN